jgi:uncharacterized membrane protein YGL010W
MVINGWLVVTGTWLLFVPYIGNGIIIPTNEIIFFRGVGIPPTVICWFLQFVSLQEDLRSLD